MALEEVDDLQAEAPPTKRARVEASDDAVTDVASPFDDMEDVYGTPAETPDKEIHTTSEHGIAKESAEEKSTMMSQGIPGLGLLGPKAKLEQARPDVPTNTSVTFATNDPAIEPVPEDTKAENEAKPDEKTNNEESSVVTKALEDLLGGITPPAIPDNQFQKETSDQPIPKVGGGSNDVSIAAAAIGLEMPSEEPSRTATTGNDVQMIDAGTENLESQEPEFEIDSSPYESSSDDTSDDSSSEEESDDEDAYRLLDPEEQARILMEGDGGSDDEGGGSKGAKASGGQLRTKNEIPEEVIPKPDVTITPEMKISELGEVEHIVENIVVIKAKTSGEYRVLESGSVLCLEDRSVIGVVSETLGRVQQPLYSVRFTNQADIEEAGLKVGTKVFYSEQHSTYVFTQALKAFKGSDASNLHDEEVGDEEMEFSDDEAEMEHKRKIKQKRMERRGGKQHHDNLGRGGHPLKQAHTAVGLSYDDAEDEGPYKPLARPAAYASAVGQFEAPQEEEHDGRAAKGGREDHRPSGGTRGGYRGQRGRDRGGRERPRGGFHGSGRGDGYSKPPQSHNNGYSQPPPQDPRRNSHGHPMQMSPMAQNAPASSYNYNLPPQPPQYPPQQPPFPQPYQQSYPIAPPQYQQPYSNAPQQAPGWPQPTAPLPSGAYINPAFFGQQSSSPPAPSGSPNQFWPTQPPQWVPPPPPPTDAESQRAFNEAQEKLNILKSLSGSR